VLVSQKVPLLDAARRVSPLFSHSHSSRRDKIECDYNWTRCGKTGNGGSFREEKEIYHGRLETIGRVAKGSASGWGERRNWDEIEMDRSTFEAEKSAESYPRLSPLHSHGSQ
jgi:hypothetical protein